MLVPKVRMRLQEYNASCALTLWWLTGDFIGQDVGNEYNIAPNQLPIPTSDYFIFISAIGVWWVAWIIQVMDGEQQQ